MRNRLTLILISLLFLVSCFNNENKNKILPSTSNKIHLTVDTLILVDSLTCFKITLHNKSEKIIEAFHNCGYLKSRNYYSEEDSLSNCDDKLVLENDTVKMWATYGEVGKYKFDDVTIIIEDKNHNISYIDTTFFFTVKKDK